MPAYEEKRIDGVLFKPKTDNPKAPKLSGTLKVEGTEYKIAIFGPKTSKNGNTYYNISEDTWKPTYQQGAPAQTPRFQNAEPARPDYGNDDEIPF